MIRPAGLFLLSLITLAPVEAQQVVAPLAEREIVRRQEDMLLANQLVAKGDQAMKDKDFEVAYVSYLDAVEKIPAGSATAAQRGPAMAKFSDAGIAYANFLIQNGRYSDAERVAKTILLPQFNPGYRPAVQLLSNLEQSDYYNKTVTPQFAADRDEVTKLLLEADGFYATGRYDLAIKRYEQVLNIDPYNNAARMGMERVNNQKSNYYTNARNETRSRMLWMVDRAWERPVRRFQGRETGSTVSREVAATGTEAINAKLNRIIIPKISLTDATIREAVDFLKQRSRELDTTTTDPSKQRGVNIVLKLPNPALDAAIADPNAAVPAPEAGVAAPVVTGDSKVTLALNNVPLIEALRYLTELAGLKYKVEPFAVSIVPITENTDELLTKEYRVPPGFIPANSGSSADAGLPTAGAGPNLNEARLSGRADALTFLKDQGVLFPPGASAQYIPAGSKLIVRNTQNAIDLIDTLVDAANGVQPTQVEIESKFLEITQNNLKELGFDWLLGPFQIGGSGVYGAGGTEGFGGTPNASTYPFTAGGAAVGSNPVTGGLRSGLGTSPGTAVTANSIDALLAGIPPGTVAAAPGIFGLSGIFSNTQFQVVIRALNQKKGVDLMSAPKVTTKSGNKAVVKVVRNFPYPTEFNPPEPPPADTGTGSSSVVVVTGFISQGLVTPSTPTAFETRDIGVTLEVEPVVGPDNYTIDLNLSPEVVEFEGFINYGSPILGPTLVFPATITTSTLTPNVINQPIFSTRKVTTSVSIWDGQTVALGGLIREDVQKVQDKVPLLGDIPLAGRLFRSDVDQKIKRNLIIFVTARLMDAEGRPVRQDDDQEEIVEPLGLPENLPPPAFEQEKSFGK